MRMEKHKRWAIWAFIAGFAAAGLLIALAQKVA